MEDGATRTEGRLGVHRARRRQTPVRPNSAPPARGRRPQSHQKTSTATATAAAAKAAVGGGGQGKGGGDECSGSGSSLSGHSRDLQGFDELERTLSYDNLPVGGLPEEGLDWVHVPWGGASSGDVVAITIDKASVESAAPSYSIARGTNALAMAGGTACKHLAGGGKATKVLPFYSSEGQLRRRSSDGDCGGGHDIGRRTTRRFSSGRSSRFAEAGLLHVAKTVSGEEEEKSSRSPRKPLPGKRGTGGGGGGGGGSGGGGRDKAEGPERSRGAVPTRTSAGGGELNNYDGGLSMVPWKPSLRVASRLPSESRVEMIKIDDARKSGTNHKKVGGERIPYAFDWGREVDDLCVVAARSSLHAWHAKEGDGTAVSRSRKAKYSRICRATYVNLPRVPKPQTLQARANEV